jgi:hypothetical protein
MSLIYNGIKNETIFERKKEEDSNLFKFHFEIMVLSIGSILN